jgi:phytol kinase
MHFAGDIVLSTWLGLSPIVHNGLATVVTFAAALSWLKLMDWLAYRDFTEQTLSRKLIHIGTGPLFVLCWLLFTDGFYARFGAALVPFAITLKFAAIGLGWLSDPSAVKSMTRHNDPREILRGPLYYGVAFVLCTIVFWRNSPVGILALMIMCGGDGLADIVGRRWGHQKLPFSADKSWVGSTAMLVGSFGFGCGYLALFNSLGYFQPALAWGELGLGVGVIAIAATLIEALPFKDIDNLTLTAVAIALGQTLFPTSML